MSAGLKARYQRLVLLNRMALELFSDKPLPEARQEELEALEKARRRGRVLTTQHTHLGWIAAPLASYGPETTRGRAPSPWATSFPRSTARSATRPCLRSAAAHAMPIV